MLNMNIENLVNSLVNQELVGKGREHEAIHFQFDLSLNYYTNNKSYTERQGLHLLYHCKAHFRNITAFSALTESAFSNVKDIKEWIFQGSHDSCWRNLGIFSNAYFGMAARLNAQLSQDGLKNIAPKDMDQHNIFPLFSNQVFDWIPVRVTKDETDPIRHRRFIQTFPSNNG